MDWVMTSLIFLFPAIGGLLFGERAFTQCSLWRWVPLTFKVGHGCRDSLHAGAGYDIGATSGALVSLKSAATSGTTW